MARSRSGPPVKTGACPCVADLLDYALGTLAPEDRQRVESHLQSTGCAYCRSWVSKAGTPAPPAGATAAPWRRESAFQELERRLGLLED